MIEAEILRIKKEKNNPAFSRKYIQWVDEEWQEIKKLFSSCRYDLSKIRIVRKI